MNSLHAIGWPAGDDVAPLPAGWRDALAAHTAARPARVAEQHRAGYVLADGPDAMFPAESLPEWQRPKLAPDQRAAVGDWVLVEGGRDAARIVALLPRFSAIKRGAAGEHYGQQLIAANVDTVLVVTGLDNDFNPRRIERYLLLVRGRGVQPVVVLTKADVASGREAGAVDAATAALADIRAQDVPVVAVNARDRGEVQEALAPWLRPGTTAVLVGSSGAGKSTLTNSLLGIERMKTGEVRAGDDRGRHTTTHRALVALPSGACLVDTPGMRELKPTGEEDVEDAFTDIEALAAHCRFRDCAHGREPGCAVRGALEAGSLDAGRLANFLKLRDEVAGAADRLAARRAQKTGDRVQSRALNKRLDDKYGRH
ncbi:ribosome small subunit-dependent GTPase A [Luteimonas pelagia]